MKQPISKKSIIAVRFPKNKAGEKVAAFDFSDGTTLIRSWNQFKGDLQQSNLTLDTNNDDITVDLVSAGDIVDGEVSGNFVWHKAGTEFKATPEYCAAIKDGVRKVRNSAGEIIEKTPTVGDTVITSKDGYFNESGFLTIKPNMRYRDSLISARELTRARMRELNGNHATVTETPTESGFSAIE